MPQTIFPIRQIGDALRYMQQTKHIGKIVLTFAPAAYHSQVAKAADSQLPDHRRARRRWACTVAECLAVEKGMASGPGQSGAVSPTPEAQQKIAAAAPAGGDRESFQADVTDRQAVADLLAAIQCTAMPPLRGMVHAAGLLDDGVLEHQSWPQFAARCWPQRWTGPGICIILTQGDPAGFLHCSSPRSPPCWETGGLSNYAAANAFLDGLMPTSAVPV